MNQLSQHLQADMPVDLRLQEAYKLRQAQQQAAMNALGDGNLAAEFAARHPLEPLENIRQKVLREQGLSGEVLDHAVINQITSARPRMPDQIGGCFTKGTMVHTKEGLRPIEEIKVGDYVLSSPEDGSGKPEYKQVVRTFVFKNKTIKDVRTREFDDKENSFRRLVSTGNHPFWVENVGWTRADALKKGDVLRKADGTFCEVIHPYSVYRLPSVLGYHEPADAYIAPGVGFTFNMHMADHIEGRFYNYEYGTSMQAPFFWCEEEDFKPENYLEVTVYNLEVADFHTYYVGHMGVWVRNANCMEGAVLHLDVQNQRYFVRMPDGTDVHAYRSTTDYLTAIGKGSESPDGLVLIRQDNAGLAADADRSIPAYSTEITDDMLQKWKVYERSSSNSLHVDGAYYDICLGYNNVYGGKNIIRFEGYDAVQKTLVDRKLAIAKRYARPVEVTYDVDGKVLKVENPANPGKQESLHRKTNSGLKPRPLGNP